MHQLQTLDDDGLFIEPNVGRWAEEKYRLVSAYASFFTGAMRSKFPSLIYIDVFAGPGRVQIKNTKRIYASSPMNALEIQPPFDRLIFCEKDQTRLAALKARCARQYPDRDVHFIPGDVNDNANEILKRLPQHRANHGVLSLCFVDPYRLSHLRFSTLRRLSTRWIDFLVLIASEMDAERAKQTYLSEGNYVISDFVGNCDWRDRWKEAQHRLRFGHFVIEEFGRSMEGVERLKVELPDTWRVKNTVNRDLYHLALYSRKDLGAKFWRAACKAVSPNLELF